MPNNLKELNIARVAVPTPLARLFDYALPPMTDDLKIGCRLLVPFGRGEKVGVLVSINNETDVPVGKLKSILSVVDKEPVLETPMMKLLIWASQYYAHPIGDVFSHALPNALRDPKTALYSDVTFYQLTDTGKALDKDSFKRAKVQRVIWEQLRESPQGCTSDQLQTIANSWRSVLKIMIDKGWIALEQRPVTRTHVTAAVGGETNLVLTQEQSNAVNTIVDGLGDFGVYLLDGITGSGKTEVYLQSMQQVLSHGQQVLVIVPEISLTPQFEKRLSKRLKVSIQSVHSGLTDNQRLQHWRNARSGSTRVILGTRSSVFLPMPDLGLIIIDEEHDGSLKQQDGFRYHARSLAVMRAREATIPVVLGSATPSLETLCNAQTGRYKHLKLLERAGHAIPPEIKLIDVRGGQLDGGLAPEFLRGISARLERGEQALVFINRRGFAPLLQCDACGLAAECKRCDAKMTIHKNENRLRCHHCGAERPLIETCEHCGSDKTVILGQGTERVEESLKEKFPDANIIRIDRDSTRRKGELERCLKLAQSGEANILIGTQMLAKGHHFPLVTLVGMINVDRGLFGVDFRSTEHMAQLIVQVAGRAGREDRPGVVMIQTRNPDNKQLHLLIDQGYHAFSESLLLERQDALMPPYAHMALIRAEATFSNQAMNFLRVLFKQLHPYTDHHAFLLGPATAPMERRAGRSRAQLFILSENRQALHKLVTVMRQHLEQMPEARKVRWGIDVDPHDTL